MLRIDYTRRSVRAARQWAVTLAAPLIIAGCSLPTLGGVKEPETTGSVAEPVEVQRPLPPALAYSDAAKIGQAARAALWVGDGAASDRPPGEWVNARTGSSGTLQARSNAERSARCRPFSTTVTSLAGVHQYSGTICRAKSGSVLKIAEQSVEEG